MSRVRMTKALTFDVAVFIGGLGLVVTNVVRWLHAGDLLRPELLLAAALVVALSKSPLMLKRRAGDIDIGFDCCALVYLTLVATPAQTLVLWAAGTVVAHGFAHKPVSARIFNVGITNVAGTVAVFVIRLLMPGDPATLRGLLAVAAGCSAYFVVDVVATGISLWLMGEGDDDGSLTGTGLLLPLLCFVGVDTLGYLGALVNRALPLWTLLLLGVPVGTILIAGRSVTLLRENEMRLSGLLEAASGAQKHTTMDDLEESVVRHADAILPHSEVRIRATPAGHGEIGSRLDAGDGTERYVVATRAATRTHFTDGDQQALDALTGLAVESIARIRLVTEMGRMARYDALTGLPNRALLHERISHALSRRPRHGVEVALLYCDLDGFKDVNDRVGHHVGDALLTAVADRLRQAIRPADTAARLGGDEFAVLLEDVVSPEESLAVAQRVVDAMTEPFVIDGDAFRVGVSVGVAHAGGDSDGDALLRDADMAMYRAKALGKNRVEAFQPELRARSRERVELEDDLREAVRTGRIDVHYQPVVDLTSGEIVSVEALARWQHPRHGAIPPSTFIRMSEQLGLIADLGTHVLATAHADLAELCDELDRDLRLSVNVSARQLGDPALTRHVRRLRERCSRLGLVVEVTEAGLLDDAARLAQLSALKDCGVAIAVDDFGAGQSSVAYLRRVPADILKVDRSFTDAATTDARSRSLTAAVLAMARSLGLEVVAEGIEEPAHAAMLRSLGCAYGQGYLFAEPMPVGALRALLLAGPVALGTEPAAFSGTPATAGLAASA